MASPVTTSAQALKSYIEEYGPVDEERAKEIVIEHGCPENKARFALLYPLGRKWLKKEAGVYYLNDVAPASRNGAKADGDALPPADFQTQETEGLAPPESTLAAAAVRVGISDRVARITASYLSDTADIFDPDQLWRGLGNCTELSPSERRRLFESWVSSQGLRPSAELAREVARTAPSQNHDHNNGQQPHPQGRCWVALNGQVHQTEAGQGEFDSFWQASAEADRQVRAYQAQAATPADHNNNLMVEMLRLQQENFANLMEKLETRRQADMERVSLESKHQMELLQASLKKEDPDPVAPLNRILPGAWDRFISWMTASRESGGPIIRVGESGEGIPLDAYLKLQDVELKRTAVDVFAKSLSDLVQAGLNAARSVDQGAPHPQQHVSDNLPPPPPLNLDCAGCSAPLEVLPGVREFQCPACSTAQTLSGRIMGPAPQPPAQEGAAAPPPTPSRPSYVPYWERQGTSAEPSPPPVVGEGPEKEDEAEG